MQDLELLMSVRFTYVGRAVRPVDITVTDDELGGTSRASREATGEYYYAGAWRSADKRSADAVVGERSGLQTYASRRRFPRLPLFRWRGTESARGAKSHA